MNFIAVFSSGNAIVGTVEFEGSWEDFVQRYKFDQVLQKKVELESIFGSSVFVRIKPKKETMAARQPRGHRV